MSVKLSGAGAWSELDLGGVPFDQAVVILCTDRRRRKPAIRYLTKAEFPAERSFPPAIYASEEEASKAIEIIRERWRLPVWVLTPTRLCELKEGFWR